MRPLSFSGTDLGAVNHNSVCMWGSEKNRWDERGGFVGVFETAELFYLERAPALGKLG